MAEDAPSRPQDIAPRVLSLSRNDQHELDEVATDVLQGGGPTTDTESYHKRWGYVVNLFMAGLDRENGTIRSLPESGGLLDQGHLTMQAFSIVQAMFIDHANRKTEEIARSGPKARIR